MRWTVLSFILSSMMFCIDDPNAGGGGETPPPGETPPAGETPPPGETPPAGETPPPGETPPAGETPPPGETPPVAPEFSAENAALLEGLQAEKQHAEVMDFITSEVPDFNEEATFALLDKMFKEDPVKAKRYNNPQGLINLYLTQVREKASEDTHITTRNGDDSRTMDELHEAASTGDEDASKELYRRSNSTNK